MTTPSATTPSTTPSSSDIVTIDANVAACREETCAIHFGARLVGMVEPVVTKERATQFFKNSEELRSQRACETLEELKEAIGIYLAPRHRPSLDDTSGANAALPTRSASSATKWASRRFLQADITRADDGGGGWHQIRPRDEDLRAVASITFWLAPLSASEDLTGLLEKTAYCIGRDNAICPYLSIEFQTAAEDKAATIRCGWRGWAATRSTTGSSCVRSWRR